MRYLVLLLAGFTAPVHAQHFAARFRARTCDEILVRAADYRPSRLEHWARTRADAVFGRDPDTLVFTRDATDDKRLAIEMARTMDLRLEALFRAHGDETGEREGWDVALRREKRPGHPALVEASVRGGRTRFGGDELLDGEFVLDVTTVAMEEDADEMMPLVEQAYDRLGIRAPLLTKASLEIGKRNRWTMMIDTDGDASARFELSLRMLGEFMDVIRKRD